MRYLVNNLSLEYLISPNQEINTNDEEENKNNNKMSLPEFKEINIKKFKEDIL